MTTLDTAEMSEIEGGNPLVLVGFAFGAYTGLLSKIESNPEYYTWMMDWYYD